MSMSDIQIHRKFQVINGFVQLPNNLESDRSAHKLLDHLAANDCVGLVKLGAGTGGARLSGIRGAQELIELPPQDLDGLQPSC